MSINLDKIYCNHWLKNKTIQEFCKNSKFESFIYPKHKVLTSFHIKDSIHYNALINNDYTKYEEYVKITKQQKEHNVEEFMKLQKTFDINKIDKIKVEYNFETNKYYIHDGVHRLAILVFRNIINDLVPLEYLDIKQNNCFYFVIYDHGIDYYYEICNKIQDSQIRIDEKINLQIPNDKFEKFICDIYPDTNKKHILDKNQYILNISKKKGTTRASILLVSIDKWSHMEKKCKEIELVKREIRNLYNPKFEDINKQIKPLNKGVSHNHAIHSTDLPKEFTPIYSIIDKYSNYIILDLILFFKNMKDYTIIKKDPNFPFFNVGKDDVDVLCLDIEQTVNHIQVILINNYSKYTHKFNKQNNQLDIFYEKKFIFKFDLYDSLTNMYKPYNIPLNLTKEVIDNSIIQNNIKVPLLQDELMIRQLEYDKWIKQRPDKKKHLDFIKDHVNIEYRTFNI